MLRRLLALFLLPVVAAPAFGHTEPIQTTYTRVSPNNQFVFVMLAPPRPGADARGPTPPPEQPLRYTKSGLYRNDGSETPLWEYAGGYARDAWPASDGVHLVTLLERWISPDPRTCGNSPPEPPANPPVLAFHANGRHLRSVPLGELLDHVRFCRDRGPGWHPWLKAARIDDADTVLVVDTVTGDRTRLALATGERAGWFRGSGDSPHAERSTLGLWLGIGLAAASLLGAAAWAVVLFRPSRRPAE